MTKLLTSQTRCQQQLERASDAALAPGSTQQWAGCRVGKTEPAVLWWGCAWLQNRAPRKGGGGGTTPLCESGTVERGGFKKPIGSDCGKGFWEAVLWPAKKPRISSRFLSLSRGPTALNKNMRSACQHPFPNQRPVMHASSCQPTRPLYTIRCKVLVHLATYQRQLPSAAVGGGQLIAEWLLGAARGPNYAPPHCVSFQCHCGWMMSVHTVAVRSAQCSDTPLNQANCLQWLQCACLQYASRVVG